MINLAMTFKRGDEFLTASECGIVTQAGEISVIATAAVTAGVALAAAPVVVLAMTTASAGLLAAGHHLDHKKLDAQDNTPVVDVTAS